MALSVEAWLKLPMSLSLVVIAIAIWIKLNRRGQRFRLPAGPRGIPLIGNIFSFVKTPLHLKIFEWSQEYGQIYTFHLGQKAAVVVSDVAKMKELFGIFPASTGKLLTETFTLPFMEGKYGVVCTDGKAYSEQRQFCVKNLRTFGFGKGSTMEPMIIDEVNQLISWLQLEGANRRPVQVGKNLQKTTMNAIWTLVTGETISMEDSICVDIIQNSFDALQNSANTGLAFLPWLKCIAPEKSGYRWVKKASEDVVQFVTERFREHKATFQDGAPRDLIDAYLEQLKNEKDPGSSFYGEEGWKHAVASVIGLFFGGGETTATTLTWLIFYLCCEQRVQQKLQEEIDQVIGRDREPSLKDKQDMPYTEAVILEPADVILSSFRCNS